MPRLSCADRNRAIGLMEAGVSCREVARRMNCASSTITRLLQRHAATNCTDDRRRSGRPRVTTPGQDRHIRLQHLRDRFRTAVQTATETPGIHNPRISRMTVTRRLHEHNLHARRPYRAPLLTPQHRQRRLQWARQHLRWTRNDWNAVLFSDESRFSLHRADGRERVWRRRGERYAACCIRDVNRWGGGSVMVWGGISFNHRTDIIVLDGNVTARRYIDQVLTPVVVPFFGNHVDLDVFQQDNARPHVARVTMEYFRQHDVETLPWPACSPDLSPIEHLWDELGRAIAHRRPQPVTLRQLAAALREEWRNIPQQRIQRLIRSMRSRCQACIQSNGGPTRY